MFPNGNINTSQSKNSVGITFINIAVYNERVMALYDHIAYLISSD